MPLFRCASCGKTGWSDGAECPWCASTRTESLDSVPPTASKDLGIASWRGPRPRLRARRIIDTEGREPAPPFWRRLKPVQVGGISVLVVVLVLIVLVRAGAIPLGPSSSAPPPRIQQFSAAGENWTIPEGSPRVVNFSSDGQTTLWMNFTVEGGAVSVFLCPSPQPIHASTFPPCSPAEGAGGVERYSAPFPFFNYTVPGPTSWELVFDNYGPSTSSSVIVSLVWTTPLTVTSG